MGYIIADEIKPPRELGGDIEIKILEWICSEPHNLLRCLVAIPDTDRSFELYRIQKQSGNTIQCTPLNADAFFEKSIPAGFQLDYGYPTIKKEPKEIWYKTVKALGFKQKEESDSVYMDQYGYPYKIIQLKLSKKYYLDWDQTTGECELIKHKKGWIKERMPILNKEHLEEVIELFKVLSEGR